MYDTPFRSYDAQLGRFHQIDPLADLAPGINPYRFGFNNPISLNDPTGLYEGSIQDIFNEAWARTSGDVGYFNFINGSLNRDTSIENDISWVVDFVTSGQGTAEFVMDSGGGGFWLHYNPSFVGGYVGSRNEHVGAIIQKRSLFFRLGAHNGGGGLDGMDYANNTASFTGTIVGGAQFTVGAIKNQSLWNASHKAYKALKSVGVKIQTRDIKHGAKTVLANASRKIALVGGVLALTDIVIDGQVNASHLLNITMVGISAIPIYGWVAGGAYFAADMITLWYSKKSIGQHLDNYVGGPLFDF
jgi:hypothetical protein